MSISLLRTCTGAGILAAIAVPQALAQTPLANTNVDDVSREETIVVTGSLVPRPVGEIGSALAVIDAHALEARQIVLVSDVLRTVPGVAVNRVGSQGALTQVRIRGSEANQTLVYIDGIEANDPLSAEFNFASLVSADVDQIEVIRGPQSALYGSEAIGGVISVATRDPELGFQAEGEAEIGTMDTYRGFAALGGGTERAGVRGAVQVYSTGGISQAPDGFEDDGFENLTASFKGQFRPTPETEIEGVLRFVDSEFESDRQEFNFGTVQDADIRAETEDIYSKLDMTGSFLEGRLIPRAFIGYTKSELTNFADGAQTGASDGERIDYGVPADRRC